MKHQTFEPFPNRHTKWRQSNITDLKSIRKAITWSDQRFPPNSFVQQRPQKSQAEKINNSVMLPFTLPQTVSSGCSYTI